MGFELDDAFAEPETGPLNAAARLAEGRRRGVISLKADLSASETETAVRMALGVSVPERERYVTDGESGAVWMEPGELMLFTPFGEVAAKAKFLREAIGDGRCGVAEMSDAFAVCQLSGPGAREALAKVAPLDMHPDAFKVGAAKRAPIGMVDGVIVQVAAAPETFEIFAARSVADYVWDLLLTATEDVAHIGLFDV